MRGWRWSAWMLGMALLWPGTAAAQRADDAVRSNLPGAAVRQDSALPIPIPGNAKVRMEIDARDDDLLGVVKSFLRGVDFRAMMGLMQLLPGGMPGMPGMGRMGPPVPAPGGHSDPHRLGAGAGGFGGGGPGPLPPPFAQLADVDLASMFKDIHHLHIVALEPSEGAKAAEMLAFYEKPWVSEGGRRAFFMDMDEMRMLMVAFNHGGFGAVMAMGEMVIVVRADGYPDMQAAGTLLTAAAGMLIPFRDQSFQGLGPSTEPEARVVPEPAPKPKPPAKRTTPRRRVLPRRR